MRLIADIGGTNARFGLVDPQSGEQRIHKLAVDAFERFDDALDAALSAFDNPRISQAILAVAGPIRAGAAQLTNADWHIAEEALAARLGTGIVRLVNDFEAVALALGELDQADLHCLGDELPRSDARLPRLALGPGTGLGAALWVPTENSYRSVATEAGHVSLSCPDAALRARLQAIIGDRPLGAEDVLSGPGIARLHQAMHDVALSSSEVTTAAAADQPQARATMACFNELLALFGAEAVLSAGAFGGVYLGGGLIEGGHLGLDGTLFRQAFNGEARMSHLLAKVPLFAIRRPDTALLGLARAPLE